MTKIAIVGNSGGGKTTLALRISKVLNLPLYHLDKIILLPGWKLREAKEFKRLHNELLQQNDWIIEGLELDECLWARLLAANVVIFIDLPLWQHMWWSLKRQISSLYVTRDDVPENCPMWPITIKLFKHIWYMHYHRRKQVLVELENYQKVSNKQIIHIKDARQLIKFSKNFEQIFPSLNRKPSILNDI